MVFLKKLVCGTAMVAVLAAPLFASAQFSVPGGLINLGVPNFTTDEFLEKSLAPLTKLLPPEQQRLVGQYIEFMKGYVQNIIPPDVFQEQVNALKEIERELGGPIPPNTVYTLTIDQTDINSPLPGSPIGMYANINISFGGFTPDVQQTGLAYLEWWLDGRKVLEGKGQDYFTFTSAWAGFIHSVRVRARMASGKVLETARLFPVADVDLIWSADTYAPPGYQGKRLASPASPIVVSAVATLPGTLGPYRYLWTLDDLPITTNAVGVDTIQIPPSGRQRFVEVRIADLQGTIDISKSITIDTASPHVVFHTIRTSKHDAATRTISSLALPPTGKISIVADPYVFSARVLAGLRFRWALDGSELPEIARSPDVFTLNIANAQLRSGASIQKLLQLTVENRNPAAQIEGQKIDLGVTIR